MNRRSFFSTMAALVSAPKVIRRPALAHNPIPDYVKQAARAKIGSTLYVRKPMRFCVKTGERVTFGPGDQVTFRSEA